MWEIIIELLGWIGLLSIESQNSKRKTTDKIYIGCCLLAIIILLASLGYLIFVRYIL